MRIPILILLFSVSLLSCKKNNDVKPDPIPNNKAVTWINNFGGSDYDFANSIVQLSSGEYVFAGNTRSADGDVPGVRMGYDAWLTKVDANGKKIWSFTYGDQNDNYATSVEKTPDGGFLMVGYTFFNFQNFAWAMKTDANGNKVWQKDMGTSTDAKPMAMVASNDGGYLFVGYTSTGSNRDGWIKKIDVNGNQIFSKTLGGTSEDQLTSLIKNSDGSFTMTGFTTSRDGDMTGNQGSYDGWILKIDASGNKIWSKNYGGSDEDYLNGIIQMADGGYIVAGNTKSKNGDIPLNKGGLDEWLIKLDASGNKVWSKTYGGANEEYITSIVNTSTGGFITMGYSNSTTGDVTRPNNNFSGWLLKLDENGTKLAASTYGHTSELDDRSNTMIRTQDGGYMIGGYTWVPGSGYNAWLVKIDNL